MPRPPRKKVPLQPAGARSNEQPTPLPAKTSTKPQSSAPNSSSRVGVRATPGPRARNGRDRPPSVPTSAMKIQNTPSFISFTQRPRQGSILSMVQRSGDEDEDGGLENDDTTFFSLGRTPSASPTMSPSGKKRKSGGVGEEGMRKRRSTRASAAMEAMRDDSETDFETGIEVQVPASAEERKGSPELPEARPVDEADLTTLESTMYPSSPASEDIARAFVSGARKMQTRRPQRLAVLQAQKQANARQIPRAPDTPLEEAASPVSSPLSSPTQKAVATRTRKERPVKVIRTADLAALLPKRKGRRSRYVEVEAESSSPQPEVLSEEERQPVRRGRSQAQKGGKTAGKQAKTYSRRESDYHEDENEDDQDDDDDTEVVAEVTEQDEPLSKELQDAADKFKDVDQWELSFESVDAGEGSASSQWR